MDIAKFLTARLDEDKQVARAAAEEAGGSSVFGELDRVGQWSATSDGIYADTGYRNGPFAADPYGSLAEEIGTHIVRHDPASVLREVAAKRKRLAMYVEQRAINDTIANNPDDYTWAQAQAAIGILTGLEASVRFDAEVHADHPDYDPAWAMEQSA